MNRRFFLKQNHPVKYKIYERCEELNAWALCKGIHTRGLKYISFKLIVWTYLIQARLLSNVQEKEMDI